MYLLPFQPPIVKQGVPHHLVRLFQRPLTSIENQIITLMPNNPREVAFQEEPNSTTRFQRCVEWLIKEALHCWERLPRAKATFFRKELPNDASRIAPHFWANGELKNMCSTDSMALEPKWGQLLSTSVEILPTSFVHCHCLVKYSPKGRPLRFVPYVHVKWCSI